MKTTHTQESPRGETAARWQLDGETIGEEGGREGRREGEKNHRIKRRDFVHNPSAARWRNWAEAYRDAEKLIRKQGVKIGLNVLRSQIHYCGQRAVEAAKEHAGRKVAA